MDFVINDLDKDGMDKLVKNVEKWMDTDKLSYPNIYGYKKNGKTLEISFHDSDSAKVFKMLKNEGHTPT